MRYFLSRYNRFYSLVIHRQLYILYAITLIIEITFFAGWFFGSYLLIDSKIRTIEQSLRTGQRFLADADKSHKDCVKLHHDINTLKKKLRHAQFCNKKSENRLACIMHAADYVGISLRDCALGSSAKKTINALQQIECCFDATMDQLIAFFERLSDQKVVIECTQLDMQGEMVYAVRCNLQLKKSPSTLEKS